MTTTDKLSRHEKQHLYVYAAVAGRPAARLVARLPSMPQGGPPRVLPLDATCSVIVSDVPASIYGATALESRLRDLDWVARAGAAHHAVADALSDSAVVLPLRLFTMFSTEQKAVTTLGKARSRIEKAFARVTGRREWVLRIGKPQADDASPKLAHDPKRAKADVAGAAGLSTVAREDDTRAKASAPRSGTDFLRARADARKQVAERAARVKRDVVAVFDTLRGVADESVTRPIEPGTNLLLDAAFLVETRKFKRFKNALTRAADGLLRDGCPISLTGPWPPYSFASLEGTRRG